MTKPDQDSVKKMFWLDESSGVLYWRTSPSRNVKPWQKAGFTQAGRMRLKVKIKSKDHMVHNIVWIYKHGKIEDGMVVDHIDRNEGNNRPDNLRLVTRSMNCQNRIYRKSKNTHVGVYEHLGGWVARITVQGEIKHLGFFRSKEDAIKARTHAVLNLNQLHLIEK